MPEIQELSTLAYDVTSNSNVHPPTEDDDEGWGVTVDQLTKDIGSLLFNRDVPVESNTNMDEIMLHISHADNVTESNVVAELNTTSINTRRWKIVAIDGNDEHANARVDSTLSSVENLLITGAVMSIGKFIPTC